MLCFFSGQACGQVALGVAVGLLSHLFVMSLLVRLFPRIFSRIFVVSETSRQALALMAHRQRHARNVQLKHKHFSFEYNRVLVRYEYPLSSGRADP